MTYMQFATSCAISYGGGARELVPRPGYQETSRNICHSSLCFGFQSACYSDRKNLIGIAFSEIRHQWEGKFHSEIVIVNGF